MFAVAIRSALSCSNSLWRSSRTTARLVNAFGEGEGESSRVRVEKRVRVRMSVRVELTVRARVRIG